MYKVLIVEDEKLIRKGLIFSINWSEYNCSVVGEAENGKEGSEKILEYEPDIVIMDINMPVMNGLKMLEKTFDEVEYCAIVISGHSDFDYAKQAIHYGVSEYLLKPVDHEELKRALVRATKHLEMRRNFEYVRQQKEMITTQVIAVELVSEQLSYFVQSMIKIIEERYMDKLTMQDCVVELSASTTLLNKKFKKETGTTFNDYLNRYRIQKAIELLKENKMPVYQIAECTGFRNYKYFNQVFNKYVGCSPTSYQTAL